MYAISPGLQFIPASQSARSGSKGNSAPCGWRYRSSHTSSREPHRDRHHRDHNGQHKCIHDVIYQNSSLFQPPPCLAGSFVAFTMRKYGNTSAHNLIFNWPLSVVYPPFVSWMASRMSECSTRKSTS